MKERKGKQKTKIQTKTNLTKLVSKFTGSVSLSLNRQMCAFVFLFSLLLFFFFSSFFFNMIKEIIVKH